jgi:ankyrin repeat protein
MLGDDMPRDLPARPDLGQLRRQAKELAAAARSGDPAALERIRALVPAGTPLTLSAAQLAIAREYGFTSWPRLRAEAQARSSELAERVEEFLFASIRHPVRAAAMLERDPRIATYDFRTAVMLGDAARVRQVLARDPALATRPDAGSGWAPLNAVCSSRWHRLDPARAGGLTEVARALLDAGADPEAMAGPPDRPDRRWTALCSAVTGAANPAITRLLLERGARPDDQMLYLAGFNDSDECLRLLLPYAPGIAHTTALAAPISTNDIDRLRLLLDAGADPNHRLDGGLFGESYENLPPIPPLYAATEFGASPALIGLLLERGADPDAPGWHGRTPGQIATRRGRADLAALLARHGARDSASGIDRFLGACLRADRAQAEQMIAADPGLSARLTGDDHQALIHAADHADAEAVQLMLDLGFPPGTRASAENHGATALHTAAAAGGPETVRLLVRRGADIEARDTTWDSTPLEWAIVGSGLRLGQAAHPDWIATVRTLIDAGASTGAITLSPDDPKPPSPEVAELLLSYGIGRETATNG